MSGNTRQRVCSLPATQFCRKRSRLSRARQQAVSPKRSIAPRKPLADARGSNLDRSHSLERVVRPTVYSVLVAAPNREVFAKHLVH